MDTEKALPLAGLHAARRAQLNLASKSERKKRGKEERSQTTSYREMRGEIVGLSCRGTSMSAFGERAQIRVRAQLNKGYGKERD